MSRPVAYITLHDEYTKTLGIIESHAKGFSIGCDLCEWGNEAPDNPTGVAMLIAHLNTHHPVTS